MTDELFQKAKIVADDIDDVKKELAMWKSATNYLCGNIRVAFGDKSAAKYLDIKNIISFKNLKEIAIEKLEGELKALKDEFSNI